MERVKQHLYDCMALCRKAFRDYFLYEVPECVFCMSGVNIGIIPEQPDIVKSFTIDLVHGMISL